VALAGFGRQIHKANGAPPLADLADKLRKDLAHPDRRLARLYANGILANDLIAMFAPQASENGASKA
jgi:hypothetical protein